MTRSLALAVALASCSGEAGIVHRAGRLAVVDSYEKEFSFEAPRPCDIFLHQRVTDEDARLVEYDARLGGVELAAVYSLDATAQRPLVVEVYRGGIGAARPSFRIEAAEHDLVVRVADELALAVQGYDAARAGTSITASSAIDDPEGLALLGCVLPLRTQLGPLPLFLLNRASGGRDPHDPDVSHTSSSTYPILDWSGVVSILGVYLLEGVCVREQGWSCPCLSGFASPLTGPIEGWCDGEGASASPWP